MPEIESSALNSAQTVHEGFVIVHNMGGGHDHITPPNLFDDVSLEPAHESQDHRPPCRRLSRYCPSARAG